MAMPPAIPDAVRAACARVAGQAAHARIDAERIAAYAAELPDAGALPGIDAQTHWTDGDREGRAAFWLTLDAINFGSGWFPTLRKRAGRSGYFTIAMGLRDRFAALGPWRAAELADVTPSQVAGVLGQDPGHELMALFAAGLRDLGERLCADHGGRFLGPIEAAGTSGVALVGELASWPCFADASTYRGDAVPFFKRAQIAAADLSAGGVAAFDDLHRLTLFADNLVPHVLALDGVLRLSPHLAGAIRAGELIEHGSEPEVELRAGAVHAAELICAARPDLDPRTVDALLWTRGGGPRYKAVPRPRCRTTAY